MSEMYNRIEELCKKRGVNVTSMCRDAGVPRGNLTDLKMGRQASLSSRNLGKIADYFGVPMEFLLGKEQKETPALQEEDELKLKVAAYWGGGEDLPREELDELWDDARSYFRFKMREKRKGSEGSGT